MEHVKDILLRVVPQRGGRVTDEELERRQKESAWWGKDSPSAELYRLARIGLECHRLVAERHAQRGFEDVDFFDGITNHPAWRQDVD